MRVPVTVESDLTGTLAPSWAGGRVGTTRTRP